MGKRLYDGYDYEEAYRRSVEDMEEGELERLLKEKKINILYRTKTTKAGRSVEVDIYPVFRTPNDAKREKQGRETPPSQKNLNSKYAQRYLNNLVAANFTEADLWGTFTYDAAHLPESPEEAKRTFQNFIRRVNRKRKKEGKQNLKYIYVTEWSDDPDKSIRCHHHMIFSGDVDRDELEAMWTAGRRTETKRLAPDDDTHVTGLVKYITKDPKGSKRWSASKNLKKPEVTRSYSKFKKRKVERMAHDHALLESALKKQYPDCRFIDAQVRINDINGGYYIYARMVRTAREEKKRRKQGGARQYVGG